jgi:NTP pyrophosphatase (non-canonical NTP hydrolase)
MNDPGYNSWPNDPLAPYSKRGKDMSYGLMQTLPPGTLKNFITLSNIIRECGEDSIAWFPETADDLPWQAACANGEAGELFNATKKVKRGTDDLKALQAHIEEESIDVLIYLANIWYILGTDVTEVYNAKRARNVKRFGPTSPDPAGE